MNNHDRVQIRSGTSCAFLEISPCLCFLCVSVCVCNCLCLCLRLSVFVCVSVSLLSFFLTFAHKNLVISFPKHNPFTHTHTHTHTHTPTHIHTQTWLVRSIPLATAGLYLRNIQYFIVVSVARDAGSTALQLIVAVNVYMHM